jgi:hypothetical protein
MTYSLTVPQDGQTLGSSKPQVRTNFNDAFTSFAINHVDFNTMNTGWHTFITLFTQSIDIAVPGTSGANVYSKLFAGNSLPQLFLKQGSTTTTYQLTGTALAASSTPSPIANGFTWLPGGLLIQWGSFIDTAPSPLVFPIAFPSAMFSITESNSNTNTTIAFTTTIGSPTTGINYAVKSATGSTIRWIAIGK